MKRLSIGAIIVYGLVLRLIGITNPFSDNMVDMPSAFLGNIARNYLRFGYIATKFLAVLNTGQIINQAELVYYNDHPPLSPIILSVFYKLFGISEWSTRIMPVLFSIAALIIFFLFVRLFWNETVSYVSTLIMATMPIQVIYSHMADYQGAVFLFFAISSLYFYSKWFLEHKKIYLFLFFISFILGGLTDWPIFFLVPFLGAHYFLYCRRPDRLPISLYIIAGSFVLFLAIFFYLTAAKGDLDILKIFIWRVSLGPRENINLFKWLYNIGSFSLYLFTPFAITLSLLWLVTDGLKKPFAGNNPLSFILFLFGFLHIAVFNQGAYIHDYWLFYLAPWISLASAIFLSKIGLYFSRKEIPLILICITMGLTARYLFVEPIKRASWVNLYLIFCIPTLALALVSAFRGKEWAKKNLIMASVTFYLVFSSLQVIWDRAYWSLSR